MGKGKLIIITAPSGAGKTTIVRHLLQKYEDLAFSVSATNRKARAHEKEGEDYYFLSTKEFRDKIKEEEFLEWEEVYDEQYYGTLKSEVERLLEQGKHIVFDIEVKGATNIKNHYKEEALAIFVSPPSIQILLDRLQKRKTEDAKSLRKRIRRAKMEMQYENSFDQVLVNDLLEVALEEAEQMIETFIKDIKVV